MSSKVFVKPNGDLYREGDVMYRRQLADTLDIIASDNGVYNMYNGSLAQRILQDLHDIGYWHSLLAHMSSYCRLSVCLSVCDKVYRGYI